MLLQFAAGWILGLAAEERRRIPRASGAAMILAALGLWTGEAAFHLFTELWRPLLWGVPALLTVAGALTLEIGAPPRERRGEVRSASPVSLCAVRSGLTLGDASYAIYILHLPATALVAHTLGWSNPWLFLPAALAASVAAGLAARAWVERPLLGALRSWGGG
jgi:exopolysaccharide production protein ExoZ